ncbi:MAG: hypothetical protein V4499_04270 [Pseudomonadota bacterium]
MRLTIIAALAATSLLSLSACKQATTSGNMSNGNAAAPAAAATGIDGTWKADLSSVQINQKPDQMLLKAGQFSCATCTPPLTIAADGALHAVTRPYSDQISVKVDDDHNVTWTSKKGGRAMGQTKYSVSADGKKLTVSFTDSSIPNAKPVTGSLTETRVADAPAGAHAISGSWKVDKYNNVSDEGLTVTYKLDGDTLHMSSPVGTSYDAKLDGSDAPIKGDVGGTTASVKKLGDNSYQETDKRGGKVVNVTTFTVRSDGKLNVVGEDKLAGSTIKYTANRQ